MKQAPPYQRRHTMQDAQEPSLSHIFEDLKSDVSAILGGTFALLRQELSENAQRIRKATTAAIGSAIAITIGAFFLIAAINLAAIDLLSPQLLEPETAAWICTSTTGIIMIVAGILYAKRNAEQMKPEELIPSRTLESLESSFEWAVDKAEDATRK